MEKCHEMFAKADSGSGNDRLQMIWELSECKSHEYFKNRLTSKNYGADTSNTNKIKVAYRSSTAFVQ